MIVLLYTTSGRGGGERVGTHHSRKSSLPGFHSPLHSQGYGRKKKITQRSSQPTKGKISNTADNGRLQLPSLSDIKKAPSAFNLQSMNVTHRLSTFLFPADSLLVMLTLY